MIEISIPEGLRTRIERMRLLREPSHEALHSAIELEERPPPESLARLIAAICAFLLLGLLWSVITRVDIIARASGTVIPAADVIAIQHAEGGNVAAILVREGETVTAGQTLLRLAPASTESQRNQLSARRASLVLSVERERAVADGRAPDFGTVIEGFEPQKAEEQLRYEADRASTTQQRNVLASQLEQQRAEAKRLDNQITAFERDRKAVEEELSVKRGLFKKGLSTRDRVYSAQRDASDLENRLVNLRDERIRTDRSIAEAQHKLAESDSEVRAKARTKANELLAELAETDQQLGSAEDRAARLAIKAPAAGIVKGLTVKSINAVVRPGETILEVVPTGERMIVRAQVRPQDIGNVRPGQTADVKIGAYDFATYGSLSGRVERISASTFQDQAGAPFYEAAIGLDKDYYGKDPMRLKVLPGMTAEVDVKLGRRSILSYLLRPVTRGWTDAFHER